MPVMPSRPPLLSLKAVACSSQPAWKNNARAVKVTAAPSRTSLLSLLTILDVARQRWLACRTNTYRQRQPVNTGATATTHGREPAGGSTSQPSTHRGTAGHPVLA